MKVCPKCNSSYSDESLTNCPADETTLIAAPSIVGAKGPETSAGSSGSKKTSSSKDQKQKTATAGGSKSRSYIIGVILIAVIGAGGYWVLTRPKPTSPTETYKALYAAVKSKNTETIKRWMSKSTIGFAEGVSQQQKKPIEQIYENGFTATTFAAALPQMRDERIKDNMGALEVWNSKDKRWEDLPFVLEDNEWKLAIGDIFAGTYQKPERGTAEKEAEEANKMSNNIIQMPNNVNGNFNGVKMSNGKTVPVPKIPDAPRNTQSMKANANAPVK
jgi:hypothetical protein